MDPVWRRLYTAMVTPFDERGAIDPGPIGDFLDFQHTAGIEGVVVCGTNGEGPSLSVAERMTLLEKVIERRGAMGIIAATGAASIADATALTRHASAVGADAVLVLPPFFFPEASGAGVAAALRVALDAAEIPALLYHIPQVARVGITPDVADLVDRHPRLAGVKDSSGSANSVRQFASRPGWRVFVGHDRLVSLVTTLGAAGAISGTANALPELVATAASGQDGAQERLDAALDVIARYPAFETNRAILRARGIPTGPPRPPLVGLSARQERELIADLRSVGALGGP